MIFESLNRKFFCNNNVACDSDIYRFQRIILPAMPEIRMLTIPFINGCF